MRAARVLLAIAAALLIGHWIAGGAQAADTHDTCVYLEGESRVVCY